MVISKPQMSVALKQHKDFLLTSYSSTGCSGVLLCAVCGTPVLSSRQLWTPLGSQLRGTKREDCTGASGSGWEVAHSSGSTSPCPRRTLPGYGGRKAVSRDSP